MEYIERVYREYYNPKSALRFTLIEGESDIEVMIEVPQYPEYQDTNFTDMSNAKESLHKYLLELRQQLICHIQDVPEFLTSLVPVECSVPCETWIRGMYHAGDIAGVGPMASVAGAIAQELGRYIQATWGDVDFFIENGGDLYIHTKKERHIQVFAGDSVLSNKLTILLSPHQSPLGVCTSAGTVGPSLSFGKADAVVVLAKDASIADSFATRIGNEVVSKESIQQALSIGKESEVIEGILIIIGDHLGVWGNITLS